MRNLAQKQRKWKKKVSERRRAAREMVAMRGIDDTDVKVEFIQALIPLGLEAVNDMLQKEVKLLVSCYQQIFTFGNFSHNIFN